MVDLSLLGGTDGGKVAHCWRPETEGGAVPSIVRLVLLLSGATFYSVAMDCLVAT